jgi:FKBP-type peptidyl-prolyl cis-trans isomerase
MKLFKNLIWLNLTIWLLTNACVKSKEPVETSKQRENDEEIQAYLLKNKINATETGDGIYYVITETNTEDIKKPKEGDLLNFHFKSSRLDGFAIDSTSRKENKTKLTPYKTTPYIWSLLASILNEGERATFFLPYNYGYGVQDIPNVPAYSPIQIDFSIEKITTEDEQITNYIADNNYKTTKTPTGLHYVITKSVPNGVEPKLGQTVTIKYTGKLLYFSEILDADKKITTTFDSGSFDYVFGNSEVIQGFGEGVAKLKVGEKAILIFPSTLGYGKTGSIDPKTNKYKILPLSPLTFEIEIVSVK